MRNLKKVLALVIAFSMMLSVVAFAGYNDVEADADYAGAVELLSALGIFEGDEQGNFNPDKTITRAEMAAIICRALGVDVADQTATKFSDVPASHWASGYIAYASATDDPVKNPPILAGVGNGMFKPGDTLTYHQALKIVVYALGYERMASENGGWSAGSVHVANKYKITEGADTTATRGNLAILLANAMQTPVMDKTTYGNDPEWGILNGKNDKEYRTLLTDMDIYIATGVVGQKDADTIAFTIEEDSDDGEFKVSKKKNYDFEIGDSAIAAYTYQQVDAYVKKSGRTYEVVAVAPSTIGETLTILSDDIAGIDMKNGELEYFVDSANSNKTKKIDFVTPEKGEIPVEYNKGAAEVSLADFYDAKEEKAVEDVVLTFIENTADSVYDQVVAVEYTSCRVEYADADNDRLALVDGTIKFDFDAAEDGEVTYILADENGNALTIADFAEDDVVAYYANGKITKADTTYIEVIKLANAAVTGTVDEVYTSNGKKYVVIDGNDYVDATEDLGAGDEGTFYIGITGKVIEYDATLAGENYGYIVEGAIAQGSFSADKWQIKILTKADGIVTYDITDKYEEDVVLYLAENADAFGLTQVMMADVDDPDTKDIDESKTPVDVEEDKFLFEDATDGEKADTARLITFETNSKGEIKELAAAANTVKDLGGKEYNADAQSINGASLENDVAVFVVNEKDVDDIYATDISYLIDEAEYEGYAVRNKDSEYAAVVITGAEAAFNVEAGFAIVTKVSTGKDEEGDAVTKVSYVQNEEEGVLTLSYNDKSTCLNEDDYELEMGDAFMYVADANGLVSKFIVIAEVNAKGDFNVIDDLDVDASKLGKDTEIVKGYIYNEKAKKNNGKEIIYLDAAQEETLSVLAASYKYTFNGAGRNDKVVAGDFMDDVEWMEEVLDEKTEEVVGYNVCPVLFRLVDGKVVDVYASTEIQKVELK